MSGTPALLTPKSAAVSGRLIAATAVCLMVVIGVPWCQARFGSFDPLTGDRTCGDPPSEVRVWSFTNHTRNSEEAVSLQKWIARNPRRINTQYGAFCETPLHLAARFGREDLADVLIAGGADVEAPSKRDERPLHTSAAYGHPNVVRLLLSKRADVKVGDRMGKTPLHAAVEGLGDPSNIAARIEVAKLLIAAGADVNARARNGFTPLRSATSDSRNATMAALLRSYGAVEQDATAGARGR